MDHGDRVMLRERRKRRGRTTLLKEEKKNEMLPDLQDVSQQLGLKVSSVVLELCMEKKKKKTSDHLTRDCLLLLDFDARRKRRGKKVKTARSVRRPPTSYQEQTG